MTRTGMSRRWDTIGICMSLAAVASLFAIAVARADSVCPQSAPAPPDSGQARRWPAPLDRPVSLHGRDLSLRDALDHLAAAARIRIAYATELLPLEQRVCSEFDAVSVGEALTSLLRGTTVVPIAVGADQVVLAPSPRRGPETVAPVARLTTSVLDRIVVTGSTAGTAERPLSIALDVVDARQLAERGATTVSSALDGAVPGVWIWQQSPSSLLSRYASIRGASSFGVNYPKIYIDGIEVANPLLLTHFFPDAVDRIEVIRGPQGAALYGADAISGVINVVTRHEGTAADGQHVQVRSSAGVSQSAFTTAGALVQSQTFMFRSGTSTRSAGLGLTLGSIGAFIPDGSSRHVAANGDARIIGARSTLTLSSRVFAERAGPALSPLITPWITARTDSGYRPPGGMGMLSHALAPAPGSQPLAIAPTEQQSLDQFTLGANGTLMQNAIWTQAVVAGVDGYRLANVVVDGGPIPSAADSALRAARGSAARATLRLSSVAQVGADDRASAKLTLAGEHSVLREATQADLRGGIQSEPIRRTEIAWRYNTGLIAQGNVTLRNAFFVTGGARLERSAGYTSSDEVSLLPMLGAAFVRDAGSATVKFRIAYGKGIRPPQVSLHQEPWRRIQQTITPNGLSPEEQSGVEGGVDLLLGHALSVHVTRFDQLASGLIQSVAIATDTGPGGPPQGRRVTYALQNVGEISNRGWEFQSTARRGSFALSGSLSFVASRVQRVIAGYTGDLRAGDRMLEVPARTASLSGSWSNSPWLLSLGISRASDWINYDRIALLEDLTSPTRMPGEFIGANLRDYWRQYDGVTRLRATFSRDLVRGFSLVVSGENLLGYQRGEPDNVTVVPGRTISAGLRARF